MTVAAIAWNIHPPFSNGDGDFTLWF